MADLASKLKKGNGVLLMEWGRVTDTEPMPKLVVGYTELGCSKLKNWKGFSKPNFERGPSF